MAFKINSEIVLHSEPKRFVEGGRLFRNVRIYLTADSEEDLEKVESVQYELHPTFRQRFHVGTDRTRNFEIRIWTYGFFNTKAKISFTDGTTEDISGFVRWRTT